MEITLTGGEFDRLASVMAVCNSKEHTVLSGVKIKVAGNKVEAVASDRKRIARVTVERDFTTCRNNPTDYAEGEAVFDLDVLKDAIAGRKRLPKGMADDVTIKVSEGETASVDKIDVEWHGGGRSGSAGGYGLVGEFPPAIDKLFSAKQVPIDSACLDMKILADVNKIAVGGDNKWVISGLGSGVIPSILFRQVYDGESRLTAEWLQCTLAVPGWAE